MRKLIGSLIFVASCGSIMSSDREEQEFQNLGIQYYVAARSAVMAHLVPVCGNLFHHCFEMFLKAGLSRRLSLRDLQKRFGHSLPDLWVAFKGKFAPAGELNEFDPTIAKLHHFEDIRYPDKVLAFGAQMSVGWEPPGPGTNFPSGSPTPAYQLTVTDLDRLVSKIFEVTQRNPLFFTNHLAAVPPEPLNLPQNGRSLLSRGHRGSVGWLIRRDGSRRRLSKRCWSTFGFRRR